MASRQSVRKWLDEKAVECERRMNELKEQELAVPNGDADAAVVHETVMPSTVSATPLPTVKITNYGKRLVLTLAQYFTHKPNSTLFN
uniref:Uncharacterized protein n=1 Tax=Ascaris lumbricoides TaxID=6252 RepID=A0A0M3IXE7_ASCLU